MAIYFAHQIWGSTHGLSIAFAVSAVGNLVAVIYTYSKGQQSLYWFESEDLKDGHL